MNIGSPADVRLSGQCHNGWPEGEGRCLDRDRIQLVLQIDQGNLGGVAPC